MPNSSQLRSSVSTWMRESSSAIRRADGGAVGGHVVVGGGDRLVGPAHRAAREAQAVERLRRGDLVDEVEVDVDQAVGDLVRLPDLVEHASSAPSVSSSAARRRPRRGAPRRPVAVVLEVVRQGRRRR